MQYRVYIDANPHHMDTSTRSMHGVYDTAQQALEAAREVVNTRLIEAHRPGMTAHDLLENFARRAETPFIMPEDEHSRFDPLEFARERAGQLCWREELRARND